VEVPIIGRDRELAQARAALVAALGGAGRLVLVGGEPGIGKTRLASAIAGMADEYGVPAATGYALDDPGMPPLWPWRRLGRDVPGLAAALTGAGATDSTRFAMFTQVCEALDGAADERGLLVVLDDLQWADRTSLLLLRHLAGELAQTRILVVATFRDTANGPLGELLPSLLRTEGTRALRLAGLAPTEIAQWLRWTRTAGDVTGLAGRLSARTGGNPLFVRMLVERGADGLTGFPELRQLVLAQVAQLPAPVRELLDTASVLGERIELPLLAELTGQDTGAVGALLDQAAAEGVLLSTSDTAALSFRHALVRDAVYEALAPSRRSALHERAARALERTGATEAGRIAVHWQRCGGEGWAGRCVRWARQAARTATAAHAYDEAVRFTELALRAAPGADPGSRAELVLDAARAEFLAGRPDASIEHCRRATGLAEAAGRPDLLAEAALVVTGAGDPGTLAAVDTLCAAALRAVPAADSTLRARLLARRAIFAAESGSAVRARELSADALAMAEAGGDPDALLDGLHARHFTVSAPQFLAERQALGRRACEIAHRAKQPLGELWGHLWLIDAAFQEGDLPAVDRALGRIEEFATRHRHSLAWWHLHRLRATRLALTGELDEAIAANERAREAARRIGTVSTASMYYAFLGQLGQLRGELDRETGEAILGRLTRAPDVLLARLIVPQTHVLLGDLGQARATFEFARHLPGELEVGLRWLPVLNVIGFVALALDDTETADRVYREVAGLEPAYGGDGSGVVFCAGSQERVVGDLALGTGRVDEAVRRYTNAIDMNARIGARPFLALSRLGLAEALAAKGDPAARGLAAAAAAEFRRLDLPARLAAANALVARIDAAARAANPLSPRESEVASLIAEALSNRQIADRLVLSERTVETHVRSILAKLGFATRTEIATWSLRTR